jgi:predicted DNA-binding transcriptional regulator YafY
VWAIVALGAVALMIGFATAPTRGRSDAAAVADQIKPELERQLQEQATDATVTVTDVTCVGGSSSGGTCLADVSDSLGNEQHVSISYTVDASTGEMIWHTD